MRTAVVRVRVDPSGALSAAAAETGFERLRDAATTSGVGVIAQGFAGVVADRREVQLLVEGDTREYVESVAIELCRGAFGVEPQVGVVTYVSRGTDDDAHGVLSALGVRGDIARSPGEDGLDVVYVTLAAGELKRVPESRIHTALEASLNAEVRIVSV